MHLYLCICYLYLHLLNKANHDILVNTSRFLLHIIDCSRLSLSYKQFEGYLYFHLSLETNCKLQDIFEYCMGLSLFSISPSKVFFSWFPELCSNWHSILQLLHYKQKESVLSQKAAQYWCCGSRTKKIVFKGGFFFMWIISLLIWEDTLSQWLQS